MRRTLRNLLAEIHTHSSLRVYVLFACAVLFAFGIFWLRAGYPFLFSGHDHWVTGHAMLLAESYIEANFRTPLLVQVEDMYGPVGNWAPYTGWPPLFFVLLAAWLKVTGGGLLSARVLFCLINALSAGLGGLMALRLTRRTESFVLYVLVYSMIVFGSSRLAGFGYSDTAAVGWGILLILGFPTYTATNNALYRAGFLLACVMGVFLSWQTFVVPFGCTAAMLLADRAQWQRTLRRGLQSIGVVVVSLAVILFGFQYLEAHFETNSRSVGLKFLEKSGYLDVLHAYGTVARQHAYRVWLASWPAVTALAAAGLAFVCFGRRKRSSFSFADANVQYFVVATWTFPILWLLILPEMHKHSFQVMFAFPAVTLTAVWLAAFLVRTRSSYYVVAGVLICALAWNIYHNTAPRRDVHFQRLTADIRRLTDDNTVVVFTFENRGTWWLSQRPAIDLKRLSQVQGRDHVIVAPSSYTAPEGYKEVASRSKKYKLHVPAQLSGQ